MVSDTPRVLYPQERDPVPIVQEAGWAPRPVWTAAEKLAPTGIRSPDRPARSESLYRLRYPGPLLNYVSYSFFMVGLLPTNAIIFTFLTEICVLSSSVIILNLKTTSCISFVRLSLSAVSEI